MSRLHQIRLQAVHQFCLKSAQGQLFPSLLNLNSFWAFSHQLHPKLLHHLITTFAQKAIVLHPHEQPSKDPY